MKNKLPGFCKSSGKVRKVNKANIWAIASTGHAIKIKYLFTYENGILSLFKINIYHKYSIYYLSVNDEILEQRESFDYEEQLIIIDVRIIIIFNEAFNFIYQNILLSFLFLFLDSL